MKQVPHFPQAILPDDIDKWYFIEDKLKNIMHLYDFREIRTANIQPKSLYEKYFDVAGEYGRYTANDMLITLSDKDDLCLRPDGTISILNSAISKMAVSVPQKVFYMSEMYRRERETYRQFYQIGATILGSTNIISDVEMIHLSKRLLTSLGITDFSIEINSCGDACCNKKYLNALRDYILSNDELCPVCRELCEKSPQYIFKCTTPQCHNIAKMAPIPLDYLCVQCLNNFNDIKRLLSNLGTEFQIKPSLFIPFQNNTQFVFNISVADNADKDNSQKITIISGGRYDQLATDVTGNTLPAVGMTLDVDRLTQTMQSKGLYSEKNKDFSVCICTASKNMELLIVQIAQEIHNENINTVICYDNIAVDQINTIAQKRKCSVTLLFIENLIREGKVMLVTYDQNQNVIHQDKITISGIIENIIRIKKSTGK